MALLSIWKMLKQPEEIAEYFHHPRTCPHTLQPTSMFLTKAMSLLSASDSIPYLPKITIFFSSIELFSFACKKSHFFSHPKKKKFFLTLLPVFFPLTQKYVKNHWLSHFPIIHSGSLSFKRFVYSKGIATGRDTHTHTNTHRVCNKSFIQWYTLQIATIAMGQAKARSLQLHPGILRGWQGSRILGRLPLLSQEHYQKAGSEVK